MQYVPWDQRRWAVSAIPMSLLPFLLTNAVRNAARTFLLALTAIPAFAYGGTSEPSDLV
jgi:hypothetical protein